MEKLQYDSFYKFIVSVGILLIITPFLCLHFWILGSYDVLIYQDSFDKLIEESSSLILIKLEYEKMFYTIFPCFSIICVIIGIGFFIWGCRNWKTFQQENLDKMSELNLKEKDFLFQKMTAKEKIDSEFEENVVDDKKVKNNKSLQFQTVYKGIEIEHLYFDYLKSKIGDDYYLKNDVKVGRNAYDIIAQSKTNNLDLIYNIKFVGSSGYIPRFEQTCQMTKKAEESYKSIMKRRAKSIIVIVGDRKVINVLKTKPFIKEFESNCSIDFEFMDEENLKK